MRLEMTILTVVATGLMGCRGQLAIGGGDGVGNGPGEDGGNSEIIDAGSGFDTGWPAPGTGATVPDSGGGISEDGGTLVDSGVSDDGGSLVDGGPFTAFAGAPGDSIVSALDDAEANSLCTWLVTEFAYGYHAGTGNGGGLSPAGPQSYLPAGYVGGGDAFGGDGETIGTALVWPVLTVPDCVLNLRQGPCLGTVSSLNQCIEAFVDFQSAAAVPAPCNDFVSAQSCGATVIQTTAANWANDCGGAMPITADAGACTP